MLIWILLEYRVNSAKKHVFGPFPPFLHLEILFLHDFTSRRHVSTWWNTSSPRFIKILEVRIQTRGGWGIVQIQIVSHSQWKMGSFSVVHIDLILKKKSIFWELIRNTMIRREMKKKFFTSLKLLKENTQKNCKNVLHIWLKKNQSQMKKKIYHCK